MSQYRKGYLFEKKTHSGVNEIISKFPELKSYGIESRGSKGAADIVFGIYNKKNTKLYYIRGLSKKASRIKESLK